MSMRAKGAFCQPAFALQLHNCLAINSAQEETNPYFVWNYNFVSVYILVSRKLYLTYWQSKVAALEGCAFKPCYKCHTCSLNSVHLDKSQVDNHGDKD